MTLDLHMFFYIRAIEFVGSYAVLEISEGIDMTELRIKHKFLESAL